MQNMEKFLQAVNQGKYDDRLRRLYVFHDTQEELEAAREKVSHVIRGFEEAFPGMDCTGAAVFSGPGRTEIGGNHTDHQHGCVLAGSVNMDILACVVPTEGQVAKVVSEGYPELTIDLNDLEVHPEEKNTSAALIRGVAKGIADAGFAPKGFCAYASSTVPGGSGLSSSAAYEILLGNIFNTFCCEGALDPVKLAQIGQFAERNYFGKPCGLMDQAASAIGGVVAIDFNDPGKPVIRKVDYDLARSGYQLYIIDTRSCHADLTDDYAGITREMGAVAAHFGKEVLRDVKEEEFMAAIPAIRAKTGDRAVLRALHFFEENRRAQEEAEVLAQGKMEEFLALVNASGRSSDQLLQNIWSVSAPDQQAVTLSLALAEKALAGRGAVRVHGGGFAGTIQAFVPQDMEKSFVEAMESVLGQGTCHAVSVRPEGGCMIMSSEKE